jgi:hypothetical protein
MDISHLLPDLDGESEGVGRFERQQIGPAATPGLGEQHGIIDRVAQLFEDQLRPDNDGVVVGDHGDDVHHLLRWVVAEADRGFVNVAALLEGQQHIAAAGDR